MSHYLFSATEGISQGQSQLKHRPPHCSPCACWGMTDPHAARRAAPFLLLLWSAPILAKPTSAVSPCDVPIVSNAKGRVMDSLLPEQLAAFLGSGSSGFCYWSKNFFFLGFRDMPVWFIEKLLSYQQMQVHYSLTVWWNNHRNGSCLLLFEEESARYSHHRNLRAQAVLQT